MKSPRFSRFSAPLSRTGSHCPHTSRCRRATNLVASSKPWTRISCRCDTLLSRAILHSRSWLSARDAFLWISKNCSSKYPSTPHHFCLAFDCRESLADDAQSGQETCRRAGLFLPCRQHEHLERELICRDVGQEDEPEWKEQGRVICGLFRITGGSTRKLQIFTIAQIDNVTLFKHALEMLYFFFL